MCHTLVLMVGRDKTLAETRSKVLQQAGYTVECAFSFTQAIDKFLAGDFDLILLCHSIPAEDRERLTLQLRQHTTRTPIITVAAFMGQRDPFADATIDNDPAELITGIREIVSRMGNYSAGHKQHG
jgi:DNA-binding response OmpR family regulator